VWGILTVDRNPFYRLWRGDLPLSGVFWLLGIVLRFILWGGTYALLFRYSSAFLMSGYGYYPLVGWGIALLLIEFVLNVAIWRSASRYPGRRVAGKAAKYVVVVLTLMAISNNYIFVARLKNLSLTRQEVGALNSALPVMLDDTMRLDSVVVRRGVIIFNYTLTGTGPATADLAAVTRTIRCKPENLGLLDAFRASSSIYKNEHGQIVAAYSIARADCNEP
jgi:hypothetical protein